MNACSKLKLKKVKSRFLGKTLSTLHFKKLQRMEHEEPSKLKMILLDLEEIANNVRTDHQAVERQLRKCGYDVPKNDRDGVMKVLTVAIAEAIQQKVDLKKVDPEDMENHNSKRLANLLGVKSLYDCFLKKIKKEHLFQKAESPRDMADYLQTNVTQKVVKSIFQSQFQIKWNTSTGKPLDYKFYEFCDTERTTSLFKYGPRQAHVKAVLYRECTSGSQSMSYVQSICKRKEKLRPEVYVRSKEGWKTWDADTTTFTKSESENFSWINKSIKSFIDGNADEQAVDNLEQCLSKPTLYWAVLEDRDFGSGEKLKLEEIGKTQVYVGKANNGIRGRWTTDSDNHCDVMKKCLDNVLSMETYDPLRLEGISLVDSRLALAKVRGERTALFVIKTFGDDVEKAKLQLQASLDKVQLYLDEVDQALTPDEADKISSDESDKISSDESDKISSDKSDKIYSDESEMSYSNDGDEDQTDVQATYLDKVVLLSSLNKVLEELKKFLDKTEVPLMKAAPSAEENEAYLGKANGYLNKVEEYLNEAKGCLKTIQTSTGEELAETVKPVEMELDQAKADIDDLRKDLNPEKPHAEVLLKKAEKQHRKGKRIVDTRLNIIPSDVCKSRWEPTDMGYGMNGK